MSNVFSPFVDEISIAAAAGARFASAMRPGALFIGAEQAADAAGYLAGGFARDAFIHAYNVKLTLLHPHGIPVVANVIQLEARA